MPVAVPFIYKNSYGFRLTFELGAGKLETSTSFLLRIKPGSGAVVEKNLTDANIADRAAGIVYYDVADGDFTSVASYQLQMFDNTPGRFIPSDIVKLNVKDTL